MGPTGRGTDRWLDLVQRGMVHRSPPVVALTPLQRFGGISGAVAVECDDGGRYVVKGKQVGRDLIADQIVGRLGRLIGAPVAEVGLVDVPAELVVEGSLLAHFEPGIGHGSVFVPGCTDLREVAFDSEPENADRFARLGVLFGWTLADDRRFLYRTTPPRLVYSVDHGLFLGGLGWGRHSWAEDQAAELDGWILAQANIGPDTLRLAISQLRRVADADIAAAVAAPPDSWGLELDERIELARVLARRRNDLLARLPAAG